MGKVVLFQRGKGEYWWRTEKATLRKAKKDWNCKECGQTICIGKDYIDDVFVGESDYLENRSHHHRVCLKCRKGRV